MFKFLFNDGVLLRRAGGGGTHVPTMFLLRIPSACESVYREIFVPHRKTVRLPSKSGVSWQNRKT